MAIPFRLKIFVFSIVLASSFAMGAVNPQEHSAPAPLSYPQQTNTHEQAQASALNWNQYFPESDSELGAANAHFFEIGSAELRQILTDEKRRVDSVFHVSNDMMPSVLFWLKVYAKYSTYQTIIYDKDHPDFIYQVQDDRDLFKKGLSPIVFELTSKRRLTKILNNYKSDLKSLQKNPRKLFASGTPGQRLLEVWGRRSAQQWREVEQNLRSQLGQRDRVMRGIQASQRFMPAMETIFKNHGLPAELTRIPLLESSFIIDAHSKCAAVGVWQFLERSGREYMVVDKKAGIDERLSPIKSAEAAAKMFRRNMTILGDYALAVIAYNHGARNLIKLKNKYGLNNIGTLLNPANKNSPLGFASRNYYAEFLAMLYAEKYRQEIFAIKPAPRSFKVLIVKVLKPQNFFQLAVQYNATLDELKSFNPDIFSLTKPLPKGTRIVIPYRTQNTIVQDKAIDAPARVALRKVSSEGLTYQELIEWRH